MGATPMIQKNVRMEVRVARQLAKIKARTDETEQEILARLIDHEARELGLESDPKVNRALEFGQNP